MPSRAIFESGLGKFDQRFNAGRIDTRTSGGRRDTALAKLDEFTRKIQRRQQRQLLGIDGSRLLLDGRHGVVQVLSDALQGSFVVVRSDPKLLPSDADRDYRLGGHYSPASAS
jgi:hypothetical protein